MKLIGCGTMACSSSSVTPYETQCLVSVRLSFSASSDATTNRFRSIADMWAAFDYEKQLTIKEDHKVYFHASMLCLNLSLTWLPTSSSTASSPIWKWKKRQTDLFRSFTFFTPKLNNLIFLKPTWIANSRRFFEISRTNKYYNNKI